MESKTTIGNKPYYVAMIDKFMSGWGPAKGKTNKFIIGCDTAEEAEIVYNNALDRDEMKNVSIYQGKKPPTNKNTLISYREKENCGVWFTKDAFKGGN